MLLGRYVIANPSSIYCGMIAAGDHWYCSSAARSITDVAIPLLSWTGTQYGGTAKRRKFFSQIFPHPFFRGKVQKLCKDTAEGFLQIQPGIFLNSFCKPYFLKLFAAMKGKIGADKMNTFLPEKRAHYILYPGLDKSTISSIIAPARQVMRPRIPRRKAHEDH